MELRERDWLAPVTDSGWDRDSLPPISYGVEPLRKQTQQDLWNHRHIYHISSSNNIVVQVLEIYPKKTKYSALCFVNQTFI